MLFPSGLLLPLLRSSRTKGYTGPKPLISQHCLQRGTRLLSSSLKNKQVRCPSLGQSALAWGLSHLGRQVGWENPQALTKPRESKWHFPQMKTSVVDAPRVSKEHATIEASEGQKATLGCTWYRSKVPFPALKGTVCSLNTQKPSWEVREGDKTQNKWAFPERTDCCTPEQTGKLLTGELGFPLPMERRLWGRLDLS